MDAEHDERVEKIEGLFARAKAGHVRYEAEDLAGGTDPDWAGWYAQFLLDNGLADLFPTSTPDRTELSAMLTAVDEEHRAKAPQSAWPEYYARYLISRLSPVGRKQ